MTILKNKPLRVGLIGFGMIGKVHAYGYAVLPFYAPELEMFPRVVRVVTSREETASRAARLLGGIESSTNYHDVTAADDIDIVHICSPNDAHVGQVLDTLAHNKHLYCDKPLVVTLSEARVIREALTCQTSEGKPRYTKTSQMTFHLRFYPAIQRARQLIEEAALGRIFQYRLGYYHASNASPDIAFKWKHGPAGGVIRDLGAHLFDLVDYLIGFPSELIADSNTAFRERFSPGTDSGHSPVPITVEDTFMVLTRHAAVRPRSLDSARTSVLAQEQCGEVVTGVIEGTKLATGYEDDVRLEIHGQKGAIRFSLMDPHYLDYFDATRPDRPFGGTSGWTRIACGARSEPPESMFPSSKATIGWLRGHVASLVHFVQAVEANQASSPDLMQGIRVQALLDDVERSSTLRSWVPSTVTDN
ncbi:MAG: Gfo/Idh/MocA family oxidoreductase [Thermoguttaceae bacterium]|nr:Gfo/Idh/MocA family oxidoreductase [Thermoguttaceae bacterium]